MVYLGHVAHPAIRRKVPHQDLAVLAPAGDDASVFEGEQRKDGPGVGIAYHPADRVRAYTADSDLIRKKNEVSLEKYLAARRGSCRSSRQ